MRKNTFRSRLGARLLGSAVGYVLDRMIGEAPPALHLLIGFGNAQARVEERLYRDSRLSGVLYALVGTGIGMSAGSVLGEGVLGAAAASWLSCGSSALFDAARDLKAALDDGDLQRARVGAHSLVSRDVAMLEETELARAAVESVAENTVDAVIAPLFYGLFGPAFVLGHRCINTLDALVGYHSERYEHFGWASARLDDIAAYVPARLCAALAVMCRPSRARDVLAAVHEDAPAHPSPNAGVAEAAFAGALERQLGGINSYDGITEMRAALGDGKSPTGHDIERAVLLSISMCNAVAIVLATFGLFLIAGGPLPSKCRT